jgi:hypothetical protein
LQFELVADYVNGPPPQGVAGQDLDLLLDVSLVGDEYRELRVVRPRGLHGGVALDVDLEVVY